MSTHVLVALAIWGAAILFIVRFFWACSPRRDQPRNNSPEGRNATQPPVAAGLNDDGRLTHGEHV